MIWTNASQLTLAALFAPEPGPLDFLTLAGLTLVGLVIVLYIYRGFYQFLLKRGTTIPGAWLVADLFGLVLGGGIFLVLWTLLIGDLAQTVLYIVGGACVLLLVLAVIGFASRPKTRA